MEAYSIRINARRPIVQSRLILQMSLQFGLDIMAAPLRADALCFLARISEFCGDIIQSDLKPKDPGI